METPGTRLLQSFALPKTAVLPLRRCTLRLAQVHSATCVAKGMSGSAVLPQCWRSRVRGTSRARTSRAKIPANRGLRPTKFDHCPHGCPKTNQMLDFLLAILLRTPQAGFPFGFTFETTPKQGSLKHHSHFARRTWKWVLFILLGPRLKTYTKHLGVDSPFFSTFGLLKNQLFAWVFDDFLKRRIPGKDGEGS